MNEATRNKVKSFITNFVRQTLSDLRRRYSIDLLKKAYPFHILFFSDEGMLHFKAERRIVTLMGRDFFPEVAYWVAVEQNPLVHREYEWNDALPETAVAKIEQIVTELRQPTGRRRAARRRPNHQQELQEIREEMNKTCPRRRVPFVADFYIESLNGKPFFAELKTPLPNLDICAESKKKILTFYAIMMARGILNCEGYLAFPYNPYLHRESYGHSSTKRVMDMEHQVIMAEEFWDKIGGTGTYAEILSILNEVRQVVQP